MPPFIISEREALLQYAGPTPAPTTTSKAPNYVHASLATSENRGNLQPDILTAMSVPFAAKREPHIPVHTDQPDFTATAPKEVITPAASQNWLASLESLMPELSKRDALPTTQGSFLPMEDPKERERLESLFENPPTPFVTVAPTPIQTASSAINSAPHPHAKILPLGEPKGLELYESSVEKSKTHSTTTGPTQTQTASGAVNTASRLPSEMRKRDDRSLHIGQPKGLKLFESFIENSIDPSATAGPTQTHTASNSAAITTPLGSEVHKRDLQRGGPVIDLGHIVPLAALIIICIVLGLKLQQRRQSRLA